MSDELWGDIALKCEDLGHYEAKSWSSETSYEYIFGFNDIVEPWEQCHYLSPENSPIFSDAELDLDEMQPGQRHVDPPVNYSCTVASDMSYSTGDAVFSPPSFPQVVGVYQLIELVITYLKIDDRLSLWYPLLENLQWRRYKTLHAFVYAIIETFSKSPSPGIKAYDYLLFSNSLCELFRAAARDKVQEEFLRPGKSQAFGAMYWKKLWQTVTTHAIEQFNVEEKQVVSLTKEIRKASYWSRYQTSRDSIWEVVVGDKKDIMIRISADNRYQCKHTPCDEFFERPGAWRKHFQNYHQKSEICKFCKRTFSHKKDLERHFSTVHRTLSHIHGIRSQKFKCNIPGCKAEYTREDNMNTHKFTKHGVRHAPKRASPGGRAQKSSTKGAAQH